MYQRDGKVAYKADLSNTLLLAAYIDNPETSFKSIHVAGTNGKGSTSHMLASVLQHQGYKVGLYTSPHLTDFRERIKVNGQMITKDSITEFIQKNKTFFEANALSFFEMTVGLAFHYFRNEKVDIAVIEVGLGGRLDSTNIIIPEVSVITNIGLDHTNFLGTTLSDIATEKAGIIKPMVPVVIGESISETRFVFEQFAEQQGASIYFAEEMQLRDFDSDLKGAYQKKNIRTTIATLKIMKEKGWDISEESIRAGLMSTVKTTGLLGRWQILRENPKVICDTAHNREGLEIVLEQLANEKYDTLRIVLGVVSDKDLETILPLFPKKARYYFCKPDIPRGMDENILAEGAERFELKGNIFPSVGVAFQTAVREALPEDIVFVGGSTFTVAEVL